MRTGQLIARIGRLKAVMQLFEWADRPRPRSMVQQSGTEVPYCDSRTLNGMDLSTV